MLHDLMVIDNEWSSESDSTVIQYTEFGWYLFINVSNKWDVNGAESSFGSWFFGPFHMTEMRINGASDNFTANLSESFGLVWEVDDFGWADECEIKRIEEQKHPFVFESIKTDFFEFASVTVPWVGFEEWSGFSDSGSDSGCCHFKIWL